MSGGPGGGLSLHSCECQMALSQVDTLIIDSNGLSHCVEKDSYAVSCLRQCCDRSVMSARGTRMGEPYRYSTYLLFIFCSAYFTSL